MSQIHYFQRYSQKENVVTNNTLMLFSRLYNHSPIRFNAFLNLLFDNEPEINIGINIFQQQKKSETNSIPDGIIEQESFKIVLETKLEPNFSQAQLKKHLDAFDNEETKILLALNPELLPDDFNKQITEIICNAKSSIAYKNITFYDIIKSFNEVLTPQDYEMKDVIEDYADFCDKEKLLPIDKYTMRVIPTGITHSLNIRYGMYYAPANRSFRKHKFLGLYTDKSIKAIGQLINVCEIRYIDKFEVLSFRKNLDTTTIENIKNFIEDAEKSFNHTDLRKNYNFFIVDNFYQTNFIKSSKGGMQNQQYFDLRDYIKEDQIESAEKIAELLKDKSW